MRALALAIALVLLGAAPVESVREEGTIDWSALQLRVVGVGRPGIISPTASVTSGDLREAARAEARSRLERLLAAVPVDHQRRVDDLPLQSEARSTALRGLRFEPAMNFSDGSVHVRAQLDLEWIREALASGASPGGDGSDADFVPAMDEMDAVDGPKPTGLILIAQGDARPALRIRLREIDGERAVWVGLPGDPLGARGLTWVHSKADARGHRLAGDRPVTLTVTVSGEGQDGILYLPPAATARVFGGGHVPVGTFGGGVVVVTQ